jgi:hypothetical protein
MPDDGPDDQVQDARLTALTRAVSDVRRAVMDANTCAPHTTDIGESNLPGMLRQLGELQHQVKVLGAVAAAVEMAAAPHLQHRSTRYPDGLLVERDRDTSYQWRDADTADALLADLIAESPQVAEAARRLIAAAGLNWRVTVVRQYANPDLDDDPLRERKSSRTRVRVTLPAVGDA